MSPATALQASPFYITRALLPSAPAPIPLTSRRTSHPLFSVNSFWVALVQFPPLSNQLFLLLPFLFRPSTFFSRRWSPHFLHSFPHPHKLAPSCTRFCSWSATAFSRPSSSFLHIPLDILNSDPDMEHEMSRYYVRGEDGLLHWIIDYPGKPDLLLLSCLFFSPFFRQLHVSYAQKC